MPDKLAVHGGKPVRTEPFPSWPIFGEEEERRLIDTLRSGRWGKMSGDEVSHFEQRFAGYHQAEFAVAVVNGTVALRLALMAAGIRAGDEVIVPPYTFIATASAVVRRRTVALVTGTREVWVRVPIRHAYSRAKNYPDTWVRRGIRKSACLSSGSMQRRTFCLSVALFPVLPTDSCS